MDPSIPASKIHRARVLKRAFVGILALNPRDGRAAEGRHMREHGTAKRATMRAGWALSSLKDWTEYRRRRAQFKARTKDVPVRRIEEPKGHRTRHTYRVAADEVLTTFQMDQRWKIVSRLY